jgi:hypothetical protein
VHDVHLAVFAAPFAGWLADDVLDDGGFDEGAGIGRPSYRSIAWCAALPE